MISSNKRTSSGGIGAPQLNDFCRGISIKLNESPNLKSRKYSTQKSQESKCEAGEDISNVID
jgi:hypothetical protein